MRTGFSLLPCEKEIAPMAAKKKAKKKQTKSEQATRRKLTAMKKTGKKKPAVKRQTPKKGRRTIPLTRRRRSERSAER
jgi:hypothetical protein